jgi:inorganic triphosphatase YgiF
VAKAQSGRSKIFQNSIKISKSAAAHAVKLTGLRRRVQVLRRRASIGDNRQWRDVITSDGPDPLAPETGAWLRGLIEDELRPLCKTQIRRTCWRLGAEPPIETTAILDEGEIFAAVGDATEPVCDLNLEMQEGDPAVLFDAALRLLDAAPLRITIPNNAERGHRLLGGAIEAATIEPLTLIPSMTVEAVLQTTCRACLWHLLRNEGRLWPATPKAFTKCAWQCVGFARCLWLCDRCFRPSNING